MRRNREIAARKKKEREEAERRRKEQEEEEEQLIRDQEKQLISDQEKDGGLADRLAAECHVEEGQESADRQPDVTSGMAESTPSAAEWGPSETEETPPPVLDLDQMMQEMNSDDEEH
jgi:hypothetical protein